MAISHEFDYARPGSLREVTKLLVKHGPGASILAGGTDLVAWLRDGLVRPEFLIDIKGIPDLGEITCKGKTLLIGARVTFSDVLDSAVVRERFPLVCEMAGRVGSPGIRNRATLVGNICSAVPSCDAGPVLLVYEALVKIAGPHGKRSIRIDDWFIGPGKTALTEGEIVTGIALSHPTRRHGGSFVKLGRYQGEDLAQASVAIMALTGKNYRVAFGAVAPTPLRARKIEAALSGKTLDGSLIGEAKNLVSSEISPITDIRATKEYRTHMVSIMLERGIRAAASRLQGKGPAYGADLI